jgi:hypothetical protein
VPTREPTTSHPNRKTSTVIPFLRTPRSDTVPWRTWRASAHLSAPISPRSTTKPHRSPGRIQPLWR